MTRRSVGATKALQHRALRTSPSRVRGTAEAL